MGKFRAVPIAIFLAGCVSSSFALERSAVRLGDLDSSDGWAAGATCTVSYYNTCTGWAWTWGGWQGGDVVGMTVDPCCGSEHPSTLLATNHYAWTGAGGPGRGFTGVVSIQAVDEHGCPTSVLAQQSFLPRSGDNLVQWDLQVPGRFVMTVEHGSIGFPIATAWPTDHPTIGPTGPQACGTCYPADRITHSFRFGNVDSPLCPGSPFYDGTCNAELLYWSAAFACPTETDATSWGTIKGLYR